MSSRRHFLASALAAGFFTAAGASRARAHTPWRNWSGWQTATPLSRLVPDDEAALATMLRGSSAPLRPVGSGHSFTALVPTDGHLVVVDRLQGVLDVDKARAQVTLGAGTRLGDIGPLLDAIDQGMFVLPDIDRQTLAGATATGTHGTGIGFTNLSGYITRLRLVTSNGETLDLAEDDERLPAARVSLGALGVVTRITLRTRPAYRLKARTWVQRTDEVLQTFDAAAAAHRHFEMFPLVHSDYALVLAIDETDDPIANPPETPEEATAFDDVMRSWMQIPPQDRRPHINGLAEQAEPAERVDRSWRILANVRTHRFNEMEYSVPAAAGADCLREVLATIERERLDVVMPLEYRYVKRDDAWLSMSYGDEDHAAISVHRSASEDYRPYFSRIEPIFWKYGGRPHWGKLHTLDATRLRRLYPRFDEFLAVRRSLDPQGRLLNAHLKTLFGIA